MVLQRYRVDYYIQRLHLLDDPVFPIMSLAEKARGKCPSAFASLWCSMWRLKRNKVLTLAAGGMSQCSTPLNSTDVECSDGMV